MRVLALVAACLCAVGIVGAAQTASTPRLTLVDRTPVVIAGTGFEARERVRVTVRAPSLVVRRTIRASENGRFRTTIEGLRLTGRLRCAYGVTIVARLQGGKLLLWAPRGLADCASPPLTPP
jgi:hypothetical protein